MNIKCPRCFYQLDPKRFVYACLNPSCGSAKPDPKVSQVLGPGFEANIGGGFSQPNWVPPDQRRCPTCKSIASEICNECHYPIPEGYHQGESVCIAFAGAQGTGKSLYIAVAVTYLKIFFEEKLSQGFDPAAGTKTGEIFEKFYQSPLFQERGILPGTPKGINKDAPQRDPLVYEIKGRFQRRRFVVFRDVAGEDWHTPGFVPKHLDYLKRADTILFVFDPMAIPEVRDQLMGLVDISNPGGPPEVPLDNLVSLIGNTGIPIGLLVSKFDNLQQLRKFQDSASKKWSAIFSDYGSPFVRDATLDDPQYNELEGELLDADVRSLLQILGAKSFINRLNNYRLNYRFFAVSALGRSPSGTKLNSHGISPFRVVGPIKWALANASGGTFISKRG